jgi:hypothetical protein
MLETRSARTFGVALAQDEHHARTHLARQEPGRMASGTELRFGTRKVGVRDADIRKAEMLMFLARNEVISNPCHWHAFPPSNPHALGANVEKLSKSGQRITHCDVGRVLINRDRWIR